MARNWTPEERRKHAEAMKKWKPWEKSTGPRTPEGKAASARNALKEGFYDADMMRLRRVLARQKRWLKRAREQWDL